MDKQKRFQYSQARLQDFADCKRRFYYRYVAHQAWPAVIAEPVLEAEHLMRLGEQFHQIVRQYLSGVSVDLLEGLFFVEGDLKSWWHNFLGAQLLDEDGVTLPEIILSGHVDGYKLVAKFDLIALKADGNAIIYDWKTARKQPSRSVLASRWQTIVYPYLLAKSGMVLNSGKLILPENITMVYWYPNYPTMPIKFNYSDEAYKADESALISTIAGIESLDNFDQFTMTEDEKRCSFCVYRSLCDRGVQAGGGFEIEAEDFEAVDLDFDQIQEIEF